ncbi:MAG: MmgE/PrpD family protein [Comamonadaceae bacterium]|nr:MmgE/PrpD family protein [Comamonadaceae bacterium]
MTQAITPEAFAQAPTRALARFACHCDFAALSASERRETVHHVLDTLVSAVAGASQPIVEAVAHLPGVRLAEADGVPVIGSSWRCEPLQAAYLMAAGAHALEMDDGNREGSIHPGTTVVPAALAAGYGMGASFSELLAATVAGYEVAVSVAELLHPHASKRGFQTTPVAGTLGAAAAAGRLLKLDEDAMENALGIAASSSSGIFAYLTGGGNIKKLHPAHAAREGLLAALLAKQGVVQGPRGVLETKAGVLQAYGGLTGDLGLVALRARRSELAIVRSYLKPYPCCRHIHPAIDALLDLRRRHGFEASGIASIDVGTYDAAMPHASLPWDTLNTAQLSFPYVMSVAAVTGGVDLQAFSETSRGRADLAALAALVRVTPDVQCNAEYPVHGPARVRVSMADARVFEQYINDPLGAPEQPISDEALLDKFVMALASVLPAESARSLMKSLYADGNQSIRSVMDELVLKAV